MCVLSWPVRTPTSDAQQGPGTFGAGIAAGARLAATAQFLEQIGFDIIRSAEQWSTRSRNLRQPHVESSEFSAGRLVRSGGFGERLDAFEP